LENKNVLDSGDEPKSQIFKLILRKTMLVEVYIDYIIHIILI